MPIKPSQAAWLSANFLLVLSLTGLLFAFWYLSDYYLSRQDAAVQWHAAEAGCDLQREACRARLPGGAVIQLSVTPRNIQPLQLEVKLMGLDAREVAVDFQGRDMYMGINRFPLQPVATEQTAVFRGQGMLSVCSDRRMGWRGRVLVETAQGTLGTWFDFEVEQHEG